MPKCEICVRPANVKHQSPVFDEKTFDLCYYHAAPVLLGIHVGKYLGFHIWIEAQKALETGDADKLEQWLRCPLVKLHERVIVGEITKDTVYQVDKVFREAIATLADERQQS